MNGELPKGWVWTSIGEIALKLRSGGTPLKKMNEYYENGTIPFVKIEDISTSGKYLYNTLTTITEEGLNNSSAWIVPKDSLLYSMYASYGIPIINKIEVATNQAIIAFIPIKDIIELDYVYYYLLFVKSSLKSKIRGTTQENLNAKIVSNIEVPLPPLAEQQRIVNKVEELFTNLDKGVESLEEVKYKLKVYRQAILKYAMEGKLTEKWREENKDRVESEILQLIKSLKEKQKILTDENSNDLDDIFSPNSWVRLRLTELTKTINPGFPCGRHNNEGRGVLHVRPMNIDREGRINLVNTKYVETNIYDPLSKGDILFNNTNSSELVGKTTYIESDTNWAYSNHMTRIRINTPLVNNKWISTYLHFLFLSGYFGGICIHHVNQSSVSSRVLSEKIPIPIPSISEQNFILQNIDQYFSIADKEFETINYLLEQSKLLRQSILKKAFEGKLVQQGPSDEPAELLLEKIIKQRLNKGELVQEKLV